jgi:signal transduction histidine kinase/ActR/RegA family two-component response regulator
MADQTPVNILLVDDQPGKLTTYEAILEELGENLLKASSARDALDCLLKNEIAVLLVDVCMPELDGYELASMIRQHPRFQKTAIIFISAVLVTDLDRLRGYECGGVDYVPVPIVPELLRAKVSVFADLYRKTRQLEALNNELEARVTERTAALEATSNALAEANQRKDEFLALLAHELRNPLAPIRTSAQLLRIETLSPNERERSRLVIERQVDHLVRLIDDLLDVSRISRGVITLRDETVNLADVVARAVEITRPLIDNRGVVLTLDVPATPIAVRGDMIRLAQAVGNVINNAAKFTDTGGSIRVQIDCDRDQARIVVRDTGVGIPQEMLGRVFDLFVQVGRERGGHGGLGLGLALVRRLVELHGGTVDASSDGPDLGTEIRIRLPRFVHGADAVPNTSLRVAPKRLVSPRRVLIVDDNRDAADTLAQLLRLQGHVVRIAYDGLESLSVGTAFEAEVVLLDLGMPQLDGYETARRMRSESWGRDALLVALTGWGQPQDRQRTSEAGFDLHLVKPVDEADIASALAWHEDARAAGLG